MVELDQPPANELPVLLASDQFLNASSSDQKEHLNTACLSGEIGNGQGPKA